MVISSQAGHLGVAWEAAVVSAFIVVIIAVVVVVVLQVRRRNRRRRSTEEGSPQTSNLTERSKEPKLGPSDLERADMAIHTPEADADMVTESEDEDGPDAEPKKKRITKVSRPRSKLKFPAKANSRKSSRPNSISSKKASDPSSDEYYFEHPSQKPPKYYWDQR